MLGLRIGPPPPNDAVGQHPGRMVVSVREEGKKKKKGRGFVRAGRRDGVGRGKEVMKNFGTRRARGPVGGERNMSVRSLVSIGIEKPKNEGIIQYVHNDGEGRRGRYEERKLHPTFEVGVKTAARMECEGNKKNGDVDVCVVERSFCISQVLANARR